MGKFDGYLICSDLDGTFRGEDNAVSVNSKAVKYFTDNGGTFTFITGRTSSYLEEQDFFGIINAPVGVFNGGMIYDYKNSMVLKETRLEFKLGEFAEVVGCRNFDFKTIGVYNDFFAPWQRNGAFADYKEKFSQKAIKITCSFKSVEEADEFKNYALGLDFFKNTFISKSWPVGVEFNSIDATKGHVVRFIKNYLGNIHTSVGIGDFENDVKLLEYADIGVAPGNAIDCVKNKADFIVKHCDEGAVADLIEIIESGL